MIERRAVLVMAYGTPRGLDDIDEYYTDIRGGRLPSPELLEELTERYRAIGGRSPLLEITQAQVKGIEERVDGARAYLGQKHAAPRIADAMQEMVQDGIERAVGLVLAPHYSSMSVGDYARRAASAADTCGWNGQLAMVESWHLEPGYVAWLAERVTEAMTTLPEEARAATTVVFSAHSLPARILESGDPYPDQLQATADVVAERAGIERYTIGWQSAGRTAEPWIGPDILDVMRERAANGARGVVICPCGFVSDHLEVLYDVDIEAAALAADLGLAFARTASPNDDPAFLDTLAGVVRRALQA
ncbi:ferrochelatase [soil metagenome]